MTAEDRRVVLGDDGTPVKRSHREVAEANLAKLRGIRVESDVLATIVLADAMLALDDTIREVCAGGGGRKPRTFTVINNLPRDHEPRS